MTDKQPILPSERAEKQKEDAKASKDFAEMKASLLREDFARTFQTEHGMRVLAWIADRCGWRKPPLSVNVAGDIDETRTTHNAMELGFYLALTRNIPIDVLSRIEYGEIKPSGFFDPEEEPKRITSKSKSKQKG